MIRMLPVSACPIKFKDIKAGFLPGKGAMEGLRSALAPFTCGRDIFFTNSGSSAFYMILEVLKSISPGRDEVILPAYTAPVLAVAVRKSGLKVVLSDISLNDFNIDIDRLDNAVSDRTLCIVVAHMFGIPAAKVGGLKGRFKDVFIIEDCAQAMGARIAGLPVGSFGDASFYSFNRGKNLPTYGGGAFTAASGELELLFKKKAESLAEGCIFSELAIPWKMLLFSLAMAPGVYGPLHSLISPLRSSSVPEDFEVKKYSIRQASVGVSLAVDLQRSVKTRYDNGMALIHGMQDLIGLVTPAIRGDIEPAFNRLPVMFKDVCARNKAASLLCKAGIETSDMYHKSMHHIFDLGYKEDSFENAVNFARGLLTIPTHTFLDEYSLRRTVNAVSEALR